MLFKKAVESKNMQNQDMEDVLLLTKKNRHNALIAQGVNCMVIQERESGAMDILKDKVVNLGVKYKKLLHNCFSVKLLVKIQHTVILVCIFRYSFLLNLRVRSILAGKISERQISSSLQIG